MERMGVYLHPFFFLLTFTLTSSIYYLYETCESTIDLTYK